MNLGFYLNYPLFSGSRCFSYYFVLFILSLQLILNLLQLFLFNCLQLWKMVTYLYDLLHFFCLHRLLFIQLFKHFLAFLDIQFDIMKLIRDFLIFDVVLFSFLLVWTFALFCLIKLSFNYFEFILLRSFIILFIFYSSLLLLLFY